MKKEYLSNLQTKTQHEIGTVHFQFPFFDDSFLFVNDGSKLEIGEIYEWVGRDLKLEIIKVDENRYEVKAV